MTFLLSLVDLISDLLLSAFEVFYVKLIISSLNTDLLIF